MQDGYFNNVFFLHNMLETQAVGFTEMTSALPLKVLINSLGFGGLPPLGRLVLEEWKSLRTGQRETDLVIFGAAQDFAGSRPVWAGPPSWGT